MCNVVYMYYSTVRLVHVVLVDNGSNIIMFAACRSR